MSPDQSCAQCGRCCEKWGWGQKGVIEDIIPWMQANRQDILQHVSITLNNNQRCNGKHIARKDLPGVTHIDFWVDPEGRPLPRCPFLCRSDDGKAYCKIHDTKPKVCTGFTPWNDGIRDYALNCPACRTNAP